MLNALSSPEILAFAAGFPLALLHAAATLAILVAGAGLYVLLTPHREIALIREGNAAAAISLAIFCSSAMSALLPWPWPAKRSPA